MDHLQDRRRRQRSQSPPQQQPSKKQRRPSPLDESAFITSTTLTNGAYDGAVVKNGHPKNLNMSDAGSSADVALRPLSLSILGVEPLDEFIREIADWIHEKIMKLQSTQGVIEVEAKLGVLKYKDADMRLGHPVRVETILKEDEKNQYDHKFESNMSAAQHKHFNELLNSLEASSRQASHPTSPLRYHHSFLVDSFYSSRSNDKIRVTRDEKSGEVKEVVQKVRMGNLDIFSPKRFADWRVSVNLEIPVAQPVGVANFTRRKDRMSYAHEEFVIDLTQVTQTNTPGQAQVMHELEVEFARPEILMQTARVRGDPNVPPHERDAFDELIRAFVNNVRILVRNARPS